MRIVTIIHIIIIQIYTHNHILQHSTNQLLLDTYIHMLQSVIHAHFSSTTVCMDLNCKNKGTATDIVPKDINIHVTIAYVCVLTESSSGKDSYPDNQLHLDEE